MRLFTLAGAFLATIVVYSSHVVVVYSNCVLDEDHDFQITCPGDALCSQSTINCTNIKPLASWLPGEERCVIKCREPNACEDKTLICDVDDVDCFFVCGRKNFERADVCLNTKIIAIPNEDNGECDLQVKCFGGACENTQIISDRSARIECFFTGGIHTEAACENIQVSIDVDDDAGGSTLTCQQDGCGEIDFDCNDPVQCTVDGDDDAADSSHLAVAPEGIRFKCDSPCCNIDPGDSRATFWNQIQGDLICSQEDDPCTDGDDLCRTSAIDNLDGWSISSGRPSTSPTPLPTELPSSEPSGTPTSQPSGDPTHSPTNIPSEEPSNSPTVTPTVCFDANCSSVEFPDPGIFSCSGLANDTMIMSDFNVSLVDAVELIEDRISLLTGYFPLTVAALENFLYPDENAGSHMDIDTDSLDDSLLWEEIKSTSRLDLGRQLHNANQNESDGFCSTEYDVCFCQDVEDARDIYDAFAFEDFGYAIGMSYQIFSESLDTWVFYDKVFDPAEPRMSFLINVRHTLSDAFDFRNSGEYVWNEVADGDEEQNLKLGMCLVSFYNVNDAPSQHPDISPAYFEQVVVEEELICGFWPLGGDVNTVEIDVPSECPGYSPDCGSTTFTMIPSFQPTSPPTETTSIECNLDYPANFSCSGSDLINRTGTPGCRCETTTIDPYCLVCNEDDDSVGCSQCEGQSNVTGITFDSEGYFKRDYNYPCTKCSDVFGSACLHCTDFLGCQECAQGVQRVYNCDLGMWYCSGCNNAPSGGDDPNSCPSSRRRIRRRLADECDLGKIFNVSSLSGEFADLGEQIDIDCEIVYPDIDYVDGGFVTFECVGTDTLNYVSDDCVREGCDLNDTGFGWSLDGFAVLNGLVAVPCDEHDPNTTFVDPTQYAIYWCESQNNLTFLEDDDCVPEGCTTDAGWGVNSDNFVTVGTGFNVDCNDFDATTSYIAGSIELECVSHEVFEVVNDSCVVEGCNYTMNYYDVGELIEGIDCNTFFSDDSHDYAGGSVTLQCSATQVVEYVRDTCVNDDWVFVEPNPLCNLTSSCNGSYDNPFPTILDASDFISNDGDKIMVLKNGTYTGSGNKNLFFTSIQRTIRSVSGSENTIVDCENNGYFMVLSNGNYDFQMRGITVQNCKGYDVGGTTRGGGIYIYSTGTLFTDMKFINNEADLGGGVYAFGNSLEFENVEFINNRAFDKGGAMYIESTYVEIGNDSLFVNNYADNFGGAFYARALSLYINDSNISNNYANDTGGAFYGESAFIYLDEMTCVTDNYAKNSAGGAYCEAGCLVLNGESKFDRNEAGSNEGNEVVCQQSEVFAFDTSYFVTLRNIPSTLLAEDWTCTNCAGEHKDEGFSYCDPVYYEGVGSDLEREGCFGTLTWESGSFGANAPIRARCEDADTLTTEEIEEIFSEFGNTSVSDEPGSDPIIFQTDNTKPSSNGVVNITINVTSLGGVDNLTQSFENGNGFKFYQVYAKCPFTSGDSVFVNIGGTYDINGSELVARIPGDCFVNQYAGKYDLTLIVSLAVSAFGPGSSDNNSTRQRRLQSGNCDGSTDKIATCEFNCCPISFTNSALDGLDFSLVCPLATGCEKGSDRVQANSGVIYDADINSSVYAAWEGWAISKGSFPTGNNNKYGQFVFIRHAPFDLNPNNIDLRDLNSRDASFFDYPGTFYGNLILDDPPNNDSINLKEALEDDPENPWVYVYTGQLLGTLEGFVDPETGDQNHFLFSLIYSDIRVADDSQVNIGDDILTQIENVSDPRDCINNGIVFEVADIGDDIDDRFILRTDYQEVGRSRQRGSTTQMMASPVAGTLVTVSQFSEITNGNVNMKFFTDYTFGNLDPADINGLEPFVDVEVELFEDDTNTGTYRVTSLIGGGNSCSGVGWYFEDDNGGDCCSEENQYFGIKKDSPFAFGNFSCKDTTSASETCESNI